ncbi:MAG: hypothetical protein U0176_01675 [Bacteroidia bacterium]
MERRLRHSLILLLLGLLLLPAAQQILGLVTEEPLHGINHVARKPQFSVRNWFAGTLQDSLLDFTTQQIGFEPSLVRLNNQLYYSLFHTAHANKVAIGKGGALYDPKQIESALGMDYAGTPALLANLLKFRQLQEILQKKNIRLAMVLVPGKGIGLPHLIPDGYPAPSPATNYNALKRMTDSLHLPYLDLINWYKDTKSTSNFPLYATTGNHWSEYCATLAADTLIGYLQAYTGTELNRIKVKSVHFPVPASIVDNDLNLGMNLMYTPPVPEMAYPEVEFTGRPRKLRVLTIGDSFYSKMFTEFSGDIFEQSHFWFYFRELHRREAPAALPTAQVDLRKEIESQDVILLYMVDSHLRELGFGFVEAAIAAFQDHPWREQEIARISKDISRDPNWIGQIATKASAIGVPLDTMLRRDAIWVLENTRVTMVPH